MSRASSSSADEVAACSICQEPLGERGRIYPCGHVFDLACIDRWRAQQGGSARQCPLCRANIDRVEHVSDREGDDRLSVPEGQASEDEVENAAQEENAEEYEYTNDDEDADESEDEELTLEELAFVYGDLGLTEEEITAILNDETHSGTLSEEEVTPDISQREEHAALEHQRLRARHPLELAEEDEYVNISVDYGEYNVRVKRSIRLEITQQGLVTNSKIIRTMQMIYIDNQSSDYPGRSNSSYREILQFREAKGEAESMLERWLNPSLEARDGTFLLHSVEIPRGQRGIHSFLTGSVTIESTIPYPKNVNIVWETELEEEGPANTVGDPEIVPLNTHSASRTRREEEITLTVE